jgi:hypothetical protein
VSPERTPRARPAALAALGALAGAALALAACSNDDPAKPISLGRPSPAPTTAPTTTPPLVSAKGRVNFKGGRRYADDLARGLAVPRAELCRELSSFDCVDEVHNITLGGVDPYDAAIYRPSRERSVSTVNAVDRIALTACDGRAKRDFGDPDRAAIFGELARTAAAPTRAALVATANHLYAGLLGRDPNADEIDALVTFYGDLAAELGPSAAPARFATLSCYAVATSEEALFY